MIHKFYNNIKLLDFQIKNILIISNLFFISNIFINNFMGIIIYKDSTNLLNVIDYYLYLTLFGTISMLFAIYLMPIFKINMKKILILGSIILFISYTYFFISYKLDNLNYNIFIIINSIGNSLFWYFLNLFEMKKTNKNNRMLYLSFIQFGKQFLNIFVPLLISLIIIIDNQNLTLLILFLATIFILILFKSKKIEHYIPPKINAINIKPTKIKHYFYNFINGSNTLSVLFLYIYTTSIIFKNIESVGFYWFVLNLFSMFVIMYLSNNLNNSVKNKIFKYSFIFIIICLTPIIYELNYYTYLFYTIVFSIVYPIFIIYSKNINIKTSLLFSKNNNNGLFIRELFLNLGRFFSIFIIYFIYDLFENYIFVFLIIYIVIFLSIEYFLNKSYN